MSNLTWPRDAASTTRRRQQFESCFGEVRQQAAAFFDALASRTINAFANLVLYIHEFARGALLLENAFKASLP